MQNEREDNTWRDALEADIADPARIQTHERCLDILDWLNDQVADINRRLESHAIRYSVDDPSPSSLHWKNRATFTMHRMVQDIKKVARRDRELRSVNNAAFEAEHNLNAMFKKVAFKHLPQGQYSEWVAEAKTMRDAALTARVAESQPIVLSA